MATAECCFSGGLNSNTGGELKLKNSLIRITNTTPPKIGTSHVRLRNLGSPCSLLTPNVPSYAPHIPSYVPHVIAMYSSMPPFVPFYVSSCLLLCLLCISPILG